jgi:23S rRNA (adenine2503-C2)-methyltransferase
MGEPSFNPNVLDVLKDMPNRYKIAGIMPSISTIAPTSAGKFFDELAVIKNRYYKNGNFQLQFSIHTTDAKKRDWLIPVKKWNFSEIADYGEKFYTKGDRKITLNFALAVNMPFEPKVLARCFSPKKFLIKITPLNPTCQARANNLESFVDSKGNKLIDIRGELEKLGFETIISIGELEENEIGTNCGQFVTKYMSENNGVALKGKSYQYWD